MCLYVKFHKNFILFFLFSILNVSAQVENNSFELRNDTLPESPKIWEYKNNEFVKFSLSQTTKISGLNSFQMDLLNNESDKYYTFAQDIPFNGKKLQRIILTYYIKSEMDGVAGFSWQIMDKDRKQIGYTYSRMQDTEVVGNSDWKKCTLIQTINENCAHFYLVGYAKGKGKVWFDDVKIENLILTDTKPSKDVKNYLKAFKKIVKKHSIYADLLNWKEIDLELKQLSIGINSIDDLGAPKDYILNKLREVGDNHSFISSKIQFETMQKTQTSTSVPYSKLIQNNIGYVNVPDFSSLNDSVSVAFATKIQELIKTLDTENNIKNWIVDLRDNRGGNMHPMLAGLGPLTGEGTSGNFISKNSKENSHWFYKNGGFGVGNEVTARVENPYYLKQKNTKIAVLIGQNTGSSGEMSAVAFIGKENVKLFGQKSGGYITINNDFKLPNGARVYLASGYVSDRNNKVYKKNIEPDFPIAEDDKSKDKTIEAAINWLN